MSDNDGPQACARDDTPPEGEWRQVGPDEVFGPGRRFRVNINPGQTEVLEEPDDDELAEEEAAADVEEVEAGAATHAGNGADAEAGAAADAAAKAAALREAAMRLARMPRVERELHQKLEWERLEVPAAAMKAAIKETLEVLEAEEQQQQTKDPDFTTANETDDAVINRLAKLAPIDCARQIDPAAAQLGIKVGFLNRLVAAARDKDQPAKAAVRGVKVAEPTPAAEPVDTGAMLTAITAAVRRHVILSKALATVIALWIAHTWIYERFQHTPRLCAISPVRRCGKSTLMALLRVLCRRTLKADNISASGTFRVIEALRPLTLLLDETDTFLKENEELRGVLDSGFERDGQVIRVVEINGEHVPVGFSTYCPVALAAIRQMPDTIADRAIRVDLQRKRPNETIEKLRLKGNKAALATLASQLARWAADNRDQLSDDPATPEALDDRQGDISVPLLAIADFAGGDWPEQARADLLEIFGTDAGPDGDIGIRLLSDIRTILGDDRTSDRKIASKDLCEQLSGLEESPWGTFGRARKPISPEQLAGMLRPYKIASGTIRLNTGKTPKGYKHSQFTDVWGRYIAPSGGSEPPHRHNSQKSAVFRPKPAATSATDVAAENVKKLGDFNDVAVVAAEGPLRTGYTGDDDDAEAIL